MTQNVTTNRRTFLRSAAVSLAFLGLQACQRTRPALASNASDATLGHGPLRPDPNGLMRLPKGFSYTTFSARGEVMDDGFHVPGAHDGMAAFPGPDGSTLLVRNHEVSAADLDDSPYGVSERLWPRMDQSKLYDAAYGQPVCFGGTTNLVFDTRSQTLQRHFYSLAGTLRNCSGGPTPWGSWITCEETVARKGKQLEQDHGYNFEVPATANVGLATPTPLKAMGRFNHEAIAVDPATGIVYQTEDRHDGLIYRFIPEEKGQLAAGGRLQAPAIIEQPSRDTRNWEPTEQPLLAVGENLPVRWIDLEDIDAPEDDLRFRGYADGAARFARGEGMVAGDGEIYFACTNGGPKLFGQVFRYRPSPYEGSPRENGAPGQLQLFVESLDLELMKNCDNMTIAPWGDLVICEDDGASSAIVGITPQGKMYHIGHVDTGSELAGACFSPDGSTLFVNIQRAPGVTLAITGPWRDRRV